MATASATYWLDIQAPSSDKGELLEILRLFPSVRKETYLSMINEDDKHSLRHFSHHGYMSCVFSARTHHADGDVVDENQFVVVDDDAAADKKTAAVSEETQNDIKLLRVPRKAKLCVLVSSRIAISYHKAPVMGISATVKRLTYAFHTQMQSAAAVAAAAASSHHHHHHQHHHHHHHAHHAALQQQQQMMMTPGWVLSMLFQQSVYNLLPDLPSLTHTIETMDAKILMASIAAETSSSSPDGEDASTPLGCLARWWIGHDDRIDESANPHLLRVARFRKAVAEFKANLSRKEWLAGALTSPKMAGVEYLHDAQVRLHDTMPTIMRSLTQMDALRELLTQSHSNLLSQISLAQATVSNRMAAEMTQLSVVATVTMPLALLTSIFGMNVPVPWQATDTFDSLVPFAVIVAIIVVWTLGSFIAARWWR